MRQASMGVALALCALSAQGQEAVRKVDRPFVRAPKPAPAAAAPAIVPALPAQPIPAAAPQAPAASFGLLQADLYVGRAFERWARERRMTLKWLVGRDLDIEAPAPSISPDPLDVAAAQAEGSADPQLVATMQHVARAYSKTKHPFVVREYDNAIVIMPRAGNRP